MKDGPGSAMAGYMRSAIMTSGMDLVYGEIINGNHYENDCVVEIEECSVAQNKINHSMISIVHKKVKWKWVGLSNILYENCILY